MKKIFLLFFIVLISFSAFSSDSVTYIKVHFLYGSKPSKKYKSSEEKWFGGKYGGHVGIEIDSNRVLNFLPNGSFHWFEHPKERHSTFAVHSTNNFWEILGYPSNKVKKATVIIPVNEIQKKKLDSIAASYLKHTPYDYAFIGMRCGSASYEMLAQLGILKRFSHKGTYLKIIYPKKLRKRLFKQAYKNHWQIDKHEGSPQRIWKQG